MEENIVICNACHKGIEMCKRRPCWGTPEQMRQLIQCGFADRLMLNWWEADDNIDHQVDIISPATVGDEGGYTSWFPYGDCTFLTDGNLCEPHLLHISLKPLEGAVVCCKKDSGLLHLKLAQTWDTEEGRNVVKLWESLMKERDNGIFNTE